MVVEREYMDDESDSELFHADGDEQGKGRAVTDTERDTLARHENRIVFYMKLAVVVVLIVTSSLISWMVFTYVRNDQEQNFQTAFKADALKLIEAFPQKIQNQIEAMDALSVAITTHAINTNSTFPNVTIHDFAARFANARVMSSSFIMCFNMYVTDQQRKGWEEYSWQNLDHYTKALADETYFQDYQDALYDLNTGNKSRGGSHYNITFVNKEIVRLGPNSTFPVAKNLTGPYLPIWHMSPIPISANTLNLDVLSHPLFAAAMNHTIRSHKAAIGNPAILVGKTLDRTGNFFSMLLARSQYRHGLEEYLGDPMSAFTMPVFDTLDVRNRKPVGTLGSVLYWRLLFKDVLPKREGIFCVLTNTNGKILTYRIDDKVSFLGDGDWHDPKYDSMMESKSMSSAELTPMERKSYTSVDLDTDFVSYKLDVYPSAAMENAYVNRDALMATLLIQGVLLMTSIVFILYTMAVGRRQRVVMDRAVASSAIVSSLFPSQVREKLYEENEANVEKKTVAQQRKETFSAEGVSESAVTSRPIANVYEATTILFADMVGFTAWSAKRQPVQVFELLETLYQAFDAIALRRSVFKVETIGDCYVAVTGLPEPQDNHAVIMVKFADDCMTKMKQLTTELVDSLGPDTAALAMRVGLHSGSVTGGVLRGQKSRFQLFGDTMNTASRMESNGAPGRIHVSRETADELAAKGKAAWIAPREDKIVAKGKGELQTYWVNVRSHSSATSSDRGTSVSHLPVPNTSTVAIEPDSNNSFRVGTKFAI